MVTEPETKLPLHVPEAQSHELVFEATEQAGSPEAGNFPPSVAPASGPPGAGPRVQS